MFTKPYRPLHPFVCQYDRRTYRACLAYRTNIHFESLSLPSPPWEFVVAIISWKLFVAFLQAYIFTMLKSLSWTGDAGGSGMPRKGMDTERSLTTSSLWRITMNQLHSDIWQQESVPHSR